MFIDKSYIENLLTEAALASDAEINAVLDKAERFEGLTHREVALLLRTKNREHLGRIFDIADKIKRHIYGNRIVMFAPLYVSDYCVNRCKYCGYKCDNTFGRRKLTMDEVRAEVAVIESMGHKRIALEAGEHPAECPIEYILECLKTIYSCKTKNGEIRRVNVNIAATTVDEYMLLKNAGIGTYILFQETYDKDAYVNVHISGPKSDYAYHLTAFDRAMEAGIDDVGAGVLFGLSDPLFEVMGLMMHNEHLEETFGVGFHTVSVPRIKKAAGAEMVNFPHLPTDEMFLKIVAVIRLAIPFTGMIISTRESAEMRRKLIKLGVSQISGGSTVNVGGYKDSNDIATQFEVSDTRGVKEVIEWLISEGNIPSFCTACYRSGRTGDRFMRLAKTGDIKNVCLPNGLMTICEYACDYGDEVLAESVFRLIDKELAHISNDKIRLLTEENIKKIKSGERDFFI